VAVGRGEQEGGRGAAHFLAASATSLAAVLIKAQSFSSRSSTTLTPFQVPACSIIALQNNTATPPLGCFNWHKRCMNG